MPVPAVEPSHARGPLSLALVHDDHHARCHGRRTVAAALLGPSHGLRRRTLLVLPSGMRLRAVACSTRRWAAAF
eukprot:3940973-Rhodomonas_salina.7